jgi:hypothetical protein
MAENEKKGAAQAPDGSDAESVKKKQKVIDVSIKSPLQ